MRDFYEIKQSEHEFSRVRCKTIFYTALAVVLPLITDSGGTAQRSEI